MEYYTAEKVIFLFYLNMITTILDERFSLISIPFSDAVKRALHTLLILELGAASDQNIFIMDAMIEQYVEKVRPYLDEASRKIEFAKEQLLRTDLTKEQRRKFERATLPPFESSITSEMQKIITPEEEDESIAKPNTDKVCQKCGKQQMFCKEVQTRSADEPSTLFFKCLNCGYQKRSS